MRLESATAVLAHAMLQTRAAHKLNDIKPLEDEVLLEQFENFVYPEEFDLDSIYDVEDHAPPPRRDRELVPKPPSKPIQSRRPMIAPRLDHEVHGDEYEHVRIMRPGSVLPKPESPNTLPEMSDAVGPTADIQPDVNQTKQVHAHAEKNVTESTSEAPIARMQGNFSHSMQPSYFLMAAAFLVFLT